MGRDNNIITWGLFGHAQFNVNYCNEFNRYDVGHLDKNTGKIDAIEL